MLTIMFIGVTSVVSLLETDTLIPTLDRLHTTKARDTLAVWNDWPLATANPCDPATRLDQLVFDGLEGDHTLWNQIVASKFGPGYDVDLVLDNYDAIYPLHGTGNVMGATAALDWSRDDTYAMPTVVATPLSGTETTRADIPAVHWGMLARPQGEAVRYAVNFTDGIVSTQRTSWGLTALQNEGPETPARRNATGVVFGEAEAPVFVRELADAHLRPIDPVVASFFVSIFPAITSETISKGATVNVTFPPGWSGAWHSETLGPWEDISPPHSTGGALHLLARAKTDAPQSKLRLNAYAPAEGFHTFDIIKAHLSNGALAEANLIVTYPPGSLDTSIPRLLAPTTPYGMRAGSAHVFGAALANGGTPIDVTDVSIEIPGGYDLARHDGDGAPIFASVVDDPNMPGLQLASPPSGWQVSADRKRVFWHAEEVGDRVHIDTLGAKGFWVKLQLSSDPADGTSMQPATHDGPNVTIEFPNGYKVTSRSWGKSPGIVSFAVPPAARADDDPLGPTGDGYPWVLSTQTSGSSRTFEAKSRGPLAHTDRAGEYALDPSASHAVNFESAVANASFEVKTRKVPVGERMRVDGDLSSLLAELSHLGFDSTLTLELYSPPSLGCVPTMEWEIDTEHLPTPAIKHALVWDADLATPSVFIATADQYLYRLDFQGEPIWAARMSGDVTSLARMDRGGEGAYILVGTRAGNVLALDPSDGRVVWTVALGQVGENAHAAYAPTLDTIVAGAGRSLNLLDPDDGTIVASASTAGDIEVVVPTPGHVAVLAGSRPELRGYDLQTTWADVDAAVGLAASNTALLLARASSISVYSADASSVLAPAIDFDHEIIRTTLALVTSDAVEDLVVALADQSTAVIDGATGALAWTGAAPPRPGDVISFPLVGVSPDGMPPPSSCFPNQSPPTYATTYLCGGAEVNAEITALAAGRDSLAIGKSWSGGGYVSYRDPTGDDFDQDYLESPSALAIGDWILNTHATAIGTNLGTVILVDDDHNTLFTSQPSDRAGQFSFYMIVPEGGFYGTHLLVARLAWNDGDGTPQEARLIDWFEVVAEDGTPQPRPHYRVALSVAQRDARNSP